jgi:predicted acyltransferase
MESDVVRQEAPAGMSVLVSQRTIAEAEVDSRKKRAPSSVRLTSLDALRGFDMFWIMGADWVIYYLSGGNPYGPHQEPRNRFLLFLRTQFLHVHWAGFHFYDLIFPLFLFMIGVSIPYSFSKRLQRGDSKRKIYAHVITRFAIMIFLGMIYNGNLLSYDVPKFQITYSVLQVLALGYLVASIILLNMNLRWQVATTVGLLVVYWALMNYVPVPGHVIGVYKPGANFGDWLNNLILGRLQGHWRFGWILETLTDGASAMLGVFAGQLLRSQKSARQKLVWLAGLGIGCLAAGLAWGIWFPIIKARWTSTYALYAGGWSYLLLALFYLVIDIWGYRKWAFPFIVIGMNAIVAYMVWGLFSPAFRVMAEAFIGGLQRYVGGCYEALTYVGAMIICWLILYWLYRQRTFVRI